MTPALFMLDTLTFRSKIRDHPGITHLSMEPRANALISELQKEAAGSWTDYLQPR
jgi:hypothetical protein